MYYKYQPTLRHTARIVLLKNATGRQLSLRKLILEKVQ